jgi:hypothetical protein
VCQKKLTYYVSTDLRAAVEGGGVHNSFVSPFSIQLEEIKKHRFSRIAMDKLCLAQLGSFMSSNIFPGPKLKVLMMVEAWYVDHYTASAWK